MVVSVWESFFFSYFILPYLRFFPLIHRIRTRKKKCRIIIEGCYGSISFLKQKQKDSKLCR